MRRQASWNDATGGMRFAPPALRGLRASIYLTKLGLDLAGWEGEDERDAAANVMLLEDQGRAVGTVRVMPVSSAYSEMRRLGILQSDLVDAPDVVEVSRLAATPGSYFGLPYVNLLLPMTARWYLSNTPMRRYTAYCRSAIAKVFLLGGARLIGEPFYIPERTDEPYRIVLGDIRTAARFGKLPDAGMPVFAKMAIDPAI